MEAWIVEVTSEIQKLEEQLSALKAKKMSSFEPSLPKNRISEESKSRSR